MSLPVVWLPEAVEDLREERAYYNAIQAELGVQFINALQKTINAIGEMPLRFSVVKDGKRRAGVRRFPHGIIFVVEEHRIVVLACFHGKRHPRRWQERGAASP